MNTVAIVWGCLKCLERRPTLHLVCSVCHSKLRKIALHYKEVPIMATRRTKKKAKVAKPKTLPITERMYTIFDADKNLDVKDVPVGELTWEELKVWLMKQWEDAPASDKEYHTPSGRYDDAEGYIQGFLDDNRIYIIYTAPDGRLRQLPSCAFEVRMIGLEIVPSPNGCHVE